MRSPANCALTILELDETGDEYRLLTPLARNPEAPIRRRPIHLPEPVKHNESAYQSRNYPKIPWETY